MLCSCAWCKRRGRLCTALRAWCDTENGTRGGLLPFYLAPFTIQIRMPDWRVLISLRVALNPKMVKDIKSPELWIPTSGTFYQTLVWARNSCLCPVVVRPAFIVSFAALWRKARVLLVKHSAPSDSPALSQPLGKVGAEFRLGPQGDW